MRPESHALITALLDEVGAEGLERLALAETLTQLVEAVLEVELPKTLDPTTQALLKGGVRAIATYRDRAWHLQHPVLGVTRTTTPPTNWSEL